jgi:AraC family transcriptional regulator
MTNSPIESNDDPRPSVEGALSQGQLHQVQKFIHTSLGSKIRLEELAKLANSSPSHFSRQFKRATGLPPRQYLIQHRLEQAKTLLRESKLTVAEVSQLVGFFDQSHLVKQFKTRVGVTPKDYRAGRLGN